MSVQFCLALLALSSLTAASDPACEELLKPQGDQTKVTGKWIYIAGTSDNEELLKQLRNVNSSWIELLPIPDGDDMTLRYVDKLDGKCVTGAVNFTFSGNTTVVTFHFNGSDHEHIGQHLVTCPDCIVWTDTVTMKMGATKARNLYIFTKTGKLDDSHLEVFKKQAACLNFPPELVFGETTDLCPFEEVAATDVKEEKQ
ncbi:alpha-1-acid glycoprotein 1-like [Sebastes fasciatus]|uniref:alpha-1-acid glycoprotein 1-like n=1 Tax=Sebastes fasciatus TaxID=394691 RepID=UPI003D9EAF56